MNILLMSRIIERTGVGNHIYQLYNELLNQGHNVFVISSSNKMNISALDDSNGGYYYINLNTHNPIKVMNNLGTLHHFIGLHKIDIVHCHHRMASLYMRWYNRIWSCPYVYTLHLAPIPADFLHRLVTSCGDQAIAISQEVKSFLKNSFNVSENKISMVLNGVDESQLEVMKTHEKESIKEELGIPKRRKVIALHSRICSVKAQKEVAEAIAMMDESDRQRFVVLCSGEKSGMYYQQLIQYISDKGIEKNFVFCGWKDARTVIGCADLMLLPSFIEGFGLSCVEAMFLRVPVARTRMGGFSDMADYVYAIDEPSPNCIKRCILEFLDKEDLFNAKIQPAYDFVMENCTLQAMTCKTVDVYKKLLTKHE